MMKNFRIDNVCQQLVSLIIKTGDINILGRNGLSYKDFIGYEDVVQQIVDFYDKEREVMSPATLQSFFPNETGLYLDTDLESEELLVKELKLKNFVEKEYVPMLAKTSEVILNDPQQAMAEFANFSLDNKDIVFGGNGGFKYNADRQQDLDRLRNFIDNKDRVIPIGFKEIDEKIGGLRPIKELCVIFARMNQGKSWIGLKSAAFNFMQGRKVWVYSGEMPTSDVNDRLASLISNYSNSKLVNGDLTDKDFQEYSDIRNAIAEKYSGEIVIVNPEEHLEGKKLNVDILRSELIKHNPDLIVIDQLSEMDDKPGRRSDSRKTKFANICNDLAHLSAEFKIPIELLCQASREGDVVNDEGERECPELSHIADCDDIPRIATTCISMCQMKKGILKLVVRKARFLGIGTEAVYEWGIDSGVFHYNAINGGSLSYANKRDPKDGDRATRPGRKKQVAEDEF